MKFVIYFYCGFISYNFLLILPIYFPYLCCFNCCNLHWRESARILESKYSPVHKTHPIYLKPTGNCLHTITRSVILLEQIFWCNILKKIAPGPILILLDFSNYNRRHTLPPYSLPPNRRILFQSPKKWKKI